MEKELALGGPMTSGEMRMLHRRHLAAELGGERLPGEYVVRKNVADDASFCRFVMTIRRFGNDEPFYSKIHRYLDVGAFKYWTMGYELKTTIIINRARIEHEPRPFVLNPTPFVPQDSRGYPVYTPKGNTP